MAEQLFTVTFTESQRRQVVAALGAQGRAYKHPSGLWSKQLAVSKEFREKWDADRQANAEALRMVAECPEGSLCNRCGR